MDARDKNAGGLWALLKQIHSNYSADGARWREADFLTVDMVSLQSRRTGCEPGPLPNMST